MPYSTDANIMHISYESGVLEDPLQPPPDHMFQMTQNSVHWPDQFDDLRIDFVKGIPKKVENVRTQEIVEGSLEILAFLNSIGGKHGVGRIDV